MEIEKKKRIIKLCSVLLAAIIVVGGLTGFVIWQDQKARALAAARAEYETTLSMAEENSNAVQGKIEEAEKLLAENPDVEEPACLTTLSAVLAEIEMPDFKNDLKDKSTKTCDVYNGKTKKYSVFDESWMEQNVDAVENAIKKIKESVEQKIARLKAEEEARIAAELAEQERLAAEEAERVRLAEEEKRKAQQNSNSRAPSSSSGAQFVGAAAYAQAYIGRTDFICDQLVCESLADAGYPYINTSFMQKATGRWVSVRYVEYDRIFPRVSVGEMQAGDVLESPGHVEIYLGNGQSIHGGYGSNQTTVVISRTSRNITAVYRPY